MKTLRDLSGLPSQPPLLRDAALVMIDCQNTYREGVMQLAGVEEALAEAKLLLARARDQGVPIFHIRHDSGAGSPYDIQARIGQISDEVAPLANETLITKHFPNAFVDTDLQERLAAAGIKNIILAGFMTHMCVNSTARGAFNLGYAPTVVAKATATRALPGGAGGTVPAEVLQAASLAALRDLFAVVVERADDIS